jgi:capsular polysaccharide biosynthesis protein
MQMEEEFDQEKAEQSMKRKAIIAMVAIFAVLLASYVAIIVVK